MTGGQPPPEWVSYILCRYVYRCLPDELRRQDADDIRAHLTCMEKEPEIMRALKGKA